MQNEYTNNATAKQVQISNLAETVIRGNNKVMAALMAHFDRGQRTIELMIASKDKRLVETGTVDLISRESGLLTEQILEEVAS